MRLHRTFLIAAVAGTSLVMAGCWGDDDEEALTGLETGT